MMLAFGIGFEFPIVLVFLQLVGVVEPATLARVRRFAIVGHRRARGRRHPVGRPDQHAGADDPDGLLLRGRRSSSGGSSSDDGRRPTPPADPRLAAHGSPVARTSFVATAAVPARPLPAAGDGRPRRRALGARRRAHRLGQDGRGRVRHRPRPGRGRQDLLHDADQGPVEPEVRRPPPATRHRAGRAAHRRQRHQRRRRRGGDDHRGAPQHDLRRVAGARAAALRRARRGPLPPGPLPRPGVGGGHHPRAARRRPGVPVGHGVERRGARGVDHHRPRPVRRRDRGAAADSAGEPLPGGRQGLTRPPPAADARRRAAQPRGPPPRRRVAAGPVHGRAGQPARPRSAALLHPEPARGGRSPRRRRPAPGDLLHLQPGRVRRRGGGVPRRRR